RDDRIARQDGVAELAPDAARRSVPARWVLANVDGRTPRQVMFGQQGADELRLILIAGPVPMDLDLLEGHDIGPPYRGDGALPVRPSVGADTIVDVVRRDDHRRRSAQWPRWPRRQTDRTTGTPAVQRTRTRSARLPGAISPRSSRPHAAAGAA